MTNNLHSVDRPASRHLRHGPHEYQFLVVGGGIAGMSIASHLTGHRRHVAILEKEEAAPLHATGRSASLRDFVYLPNGHVSTIALASHELFGGFSHTLHEKASLHLYGEGHLLELTDAHARCRAMGVGVELLETETVEERFPFLRSNERHCLGAIYAPPGVAHTIDVNALYGHFRSRFHERGGEILYGQELLDARWSGGAWTVETHDRVIRTKVIVNCSGAWADQVAARCGLTPLGLVPLKRTVIETALAPHPLRPHPHGPFTFWYADEPLYADFRPHGRVLLSPADEQVSQPCDAQPEDHDVGMAIDRLLQRTHLTVAPGRGRRWAGLRTFAPDRMPVIGWSSEAHSFFWSAAWGGFGIECAPAASALAADLLLGEARFAHLAQEHGILAEHFAPERLNQVPVHPR